MRITLGFVLVLLFTSAFVGVSSTAVQAQEALTPAVICEQALPAADPETREFTQSEAVLENGVDYSAIFCTDAGAVYVDLFEDAAPATVNNFVFLAQQNYYNNIIFHRVMENFMAQGGDPTGTGSGSPGYQFEDEFVGYLTFDRPGLLAMANAGPGTNGSQFFITTAITDWLNFKHTIFGEVLEGYDNVLAIQLRDPQAGGPATALNTVVIIDDPATVAVDVEAPVPATQDDVVASFAMIDTLLPPDVLSHNVDVFTTADVAEGAGDDVQALLDDYGHEYRVQSQVENVGCDFTEIPFAWLGYTLDAYASSDAAAAVLADEAMDAWLIAEGFSEAVESENIGLSMRTMETSVCESGAVRALTQWQRGRFVVTAAIMFAANNPNVALMDVWLTDVVGMQVYESVLSNVLRPEMFQ